MDGLNTIVKPGKKRTRATTTPKKEVVRSDVPASVLDELVRCKSEAKDYAQAFADAVKAQAEKHGLKASALRRFVVAREADKVDELRAETNDLADLVG